MSAKDRDTANDTGEGRKKIGIFAGSLSQVWLSLFLAPPMPDETISYHTYDSVLCQALWELSSLPPSLRQ